jgi:hypothetical protein
MQEMGKALVGIGLLLALIGGALLLASRSGVPLGRLPGGLHWQSRSGNTHVYFPLATSIILSLALSLILWLVHFFRR